MPFSYRPNQFLGGLPFGQFRHRNMRLYTLLTGFLRISIGAFCLLTGHLSVADTPLSMSKDQLDKAKTAQNNNQQGGVRVSRPFLHFRDRHAKIGEPIYLSLSVRHDPDLDLIFPDSLADYAPFEFLNKTYYATRTDENGSFDSVVYTLQTFNMSPEQRLRLSITDYTNGDTVVYESNLDTLYLHRLLPEMPTKPTLKVNTQAEILPLWINYNYWGLGIGVMTVLLFLVNAFLGRPIQKGFGLLVLYRRHAIFTTLFDRLASQSLKNRSTDTMEQALNLWKQYMERVDNQPFSTYTTKEITTLFPDENLSQALQSIDRAVYGGMKDEISERIFTVLRRYSVDFYDRRKAKIKEGSR